MPGGRDSNRRGLAPKRWTTRKAEARLRASARPIRKKGLLSPLLLLLRHPENDAAACDRKQIELQGEALAVLVFPCRADAVPELLFPALQNVPGDQGRGRGFALRCFLRVVFAVCHCKSPSVQG